MIWVRGDPLEYDHWESLGNSGWGLTGVLPYLKRMEHYEQADSDFRGRDGPMTSRVTRITIPCRKASSPHPSRQAFP